MCNVATIETVGFMFASIHGRIISSTYCVDNTAFFFTVRRSFITTTVRDESQLI